MPEKKNKPVSSVKADPEENSLLPKRPAATKRVFRSGTSVKPGEGHPGQTAEHGPARDRIGSQPEREKHLYPSSTVPNQGAARSNKDPQARSGKQKKRSGK